MQTLLWQGKRVLVLGLGKSGCAAADLLLQRGATVYGHDQDPQRFSSEALTHVRHKGLLPYTDQAFDCLVPSPGVPQTDLLYAGALASGKEIVGEAELALRLLKEHTILGVTGTNGKTTVTLLVAHVLNRCGKRAHALGNVGTALSSQSILPKEELIVAELSSFQLETLTTRCLDAAVLLNITPDHLDRYADYTEYAKAKMRIFNCVKPGGKKYVELRCFQQFSPLMDDSLQTYGQESHCALSTEGLHLYENGERVAALPALYQGKVGHDLENLMAAYALCRSQGISADQFFEQSLTFKKPAHRIEFVSQIKGVSYYDDSKGTNIDAVIRAVESFKGRIILIAGGVDKGFPYHIWAQAFQGKVRTIFAIGQAAPKIKKDLADQLPVELCSSLEEAVLQAAKIALPGETVLLSPGCSSFDMFRDYAHRGEVFKNSVINLIEPVNNRGSHDS